MNSLYSKGKIYLIKNKNDETLIGVGSTYYDLNDRFNNYKYETKTAIGKYINKDYENWYIELYKNYPCNCRKELEIEEGKIIKQLSTINKNIAGRTQKEYYIDKRINLIKYQLNYNKQNQDKIREYYKKYYENNQDKLREYRKKYYQHKLITKNFC